MAACKINSTQTQQRGPRRDGPGPGPAGPSLACRRHQCAPWPVSSSRSRLQLGPEAWKPVCLRAARETQDSGDRGGGRAARARGRCAGGPRRECLRGGRPKLWAPAPRPVDWIQSVLCVPLTSRCATQKGSRLKRVWRDVPRHVPVCEPMQTASCGRRSEHLCSRRIFSGRADCVVLTGYLRTSHTTALLPPGPRLRTTWHYPVTSRDATGPDLGAQPS